MSSAAVIALTGSLSAASAAAPASGETGFPHNSSSQVVTNISPEGVKLNGWLHSTTKHWMCGDHYQITTPSGKASAYPYFTGKFHDVSSKGVTATGGFGGIEKRNGDAEIFYVDTGTSNGTLRTQFDCSGRFPDEEITSIDMEPVTDVTETSAVVHAKVQAANWTKVPAFRYHVEYGTAPGDYSKQTPVQQQRKDINHGLNPELSIPLAGLQSGQEYHYRVVVDQGDDYNTSGMIWYPNYGNPDNYLVTGVDPATGSHYQISSMQSGKMIDVPQSSHDAGTKLQMQSATGGTNQQWNMVDTGAADGYVKLVSTNTPEMCMDITGGVIQGASVIQYNCDATGKNQPNQLWKPVRQSNGSYVLEAPGGQLVLTASGGGLTAAPLQSDGKASESQQWTFMPTSQ
ncbi:RICIN domain-containing protein [Streptomyces sp. TRM72054]|uniref:RICIN domain-containing protein n=1 Tax=Streptomyces sp. TRM72054 TaxID=2870562 RepID=UPI001C8C3C25|nr:RICIN domain-containing protein [Streptomyces sp. TRM72054]MBX9399426.1 RICIN domain-containing protein [Streptomyces sp. TRM72054]